jgi:hypothetical protein
MPHPSEAGYPLQGSTVFYLYSSNLSVEKLGFNPVDRKAEHSRNSIFRQGDSLFVEVSS